ncbi:hypothetical protein [uncultured Micrococcus sp.]|uniref:hypothetical protein n=1 Tax=uncultured Micrococcus sp. TaxID=114051 RepID=UPI002597D41A|nr:hypothetical protein [uncultured Micrococcus sp.]
MTTNDTITADEQPISPDAATISSGDRSPKRAARVATALADDRGAQTAEYSESVSSDPVDRLGP